MTMLLSKPVLREINISDYVVGEIYRSGVT